MRKQFLRVCSMLLVAAMLFNMLPLRASAQSTASGDAGGDASAPEDSGAESAYIVEEVMEKRTEYSKEFIMSNGLHMAAVYGNAVHYQQDGQWLEIDNTLRLSQSRSGSAYTNTAGSWQVSFPQSLTAGNGVTVARDGYVLSFRMAGQLQYADGTEVMAAELDASSEEAAILDAVPAEEPLSLAAPSSEVYAQVQETDTAAPEADAEYPETVVDTLYSRLNYADVYENTDILFELSSNMVKESVVIERYSASLYGYTYLLDTGEMTPILEEDGGIGLYDGETLVMTMPAPYLVDDAGEYCFDVEVLLDEADSGYVLSYLLPQDWLAEDTREWPVVLDPSVLADVSVSNIRDQTICSNSSNELLGSLMCGYNTTVGATRFFIKYSELPCLSSSDVIVSATMRLCENAGTYDSVEISVHKVNNQNLTSDNITWADRVYMDATVVDYASAHSYIGETLEGYKKFWQWDVTEIVRDWYESGNSGMMFKMSDTVEEAKVQSYANFYSSDYSRYQIVEKPTLTITFRNNNGLESYWDYTSASAGRAGTGYVNQYTGNLVWTRSDLGFSGNLMPVSISHVYNANDSTKNLFGMGCGWRTNFNQRVYQWTEENAYGDYYIWEDADGTAHYFLYDTDTGKYLDEDGLELTLTVSTSGYTITDKYGNTSTFDAYGRLTAQTNNQATKSSIKVTYDDTSGYISKVTDGANRVYSFTYSGSLLSKITYLGTGSSEITSVTFSYSSSKLTKVTDKDGKYSTYAYTTNNLLTSATDIDGYKLTYTYTSTEAGKPNRVKTVSEYDGSTLGGSLSITYGHNETTFIDHNGNSQTVQFNNWGNTISVQDDQGRAQYAQYAINEPVSPDGASAASETYANAKGNQLRLSSKMQNTVGNVLKDSSFENSTVWIYASYNVTQAISTDTAYHGSKSLKMTRDTDGTATGVCSSEVTVAPGESYTFSAYVRTTGSAYLLLGDGSTTVTSETLSSDTWTRLEVCYTNNTTENKSIRGRLVTAVAGTTYMDCAQIEKAPTASRYNLVENGDFRYTTNWSASTGRTTDTAAAPELSTDVYEMTGSPTATNRLSQTVQVSGSAGDCFVLAGWAKGNSVPLTGSREFAIIATFNNTDGTTTTRTLRFNPCVDSWQYAADALVAEKAYSSIKLQLAYDYNANSVLFDGIQLYKEAFGSSYTYDENGNVTAVKDIQNGTTTYTYDSANNVKSITLPDGSVSSYTYDSCHNVKTATTNTGIVYNFTYDTYGNALSVGITSDGVTMQTVATYTSDGNRLYTVKNLAGTVDHYTYDADTNLLTAMQYSSDNVPTKTSYTYDSMYRLSSVSSTMDGSMTLTASYGYTNDLLTSLTTGSTSYTLSYGKFSLLSSIKAGNNTLATYSYTSGQNNYLETLAYGNGDSVKYTYDQQGRVTAQTYEDGDKLTYQYNNDGALARVTDSGTGLATTYFYDFTDRLMKYTEESGSYSHTVDYLYDDKGNLTQLFDTIGGAIYKSYYTYDADNRITKVKDGRVSEEYAYDAYGRTTTRTAKYYTDTVLTESFTYKSRNSTHAGNLVNTATNTAANFNVTYSYTYNGRWDILSVNDGSYKTTYTYGTESQLIRENNPRAGKTWVWTYDDAGNILTRTEYAYTTGTVGTALDTVVYTYGDTAWGDLLTAYDGNTITYDGIGNPLTDGTWTYTWEHGRQLASMSGTDIGGEANDVSVSYTYNADGLRTSKTVTTKVYHTHSYTSTVVAPTCTSTGYTLHTCDCGDSYQDSETEMLPHSYTSTTVEPTCTEDGYTSYVCACGASYQETISALGHNYTETVVEPTTDSEGYTIYTCSLCGDSYTGNYVPHLHTYTTTVVEPTCTEKGYTLYACECGYSYKDNYTAALGHNYTKKLGQTVDKCTRCGEERIAIPVDPVIPPITEYSTTASAETMTASVSDDRVLESTIVQTYTYYYNGDLLRYMTVDGCSLYFVYDANGKPLTVTYRDGTNSYFCYYVTNPQGDVTAILDSTGTAVVQYYYDAWGNILSTTGSMADTLGKYNPLRYRSYVYDTETSLYYLQSRYYNPETGRFINADAFVSTGQGMLGNNMFAYCNNNPIKLEDSNGDSATLAGAILGGIWGFISTFTDEDDEDDEETKWEDILECTLLGVATGAAAGFVADVSVATYGVGAVAFAASSGSGAFFGAVNSAGSQYILDENIDGGKVAYDAFWAGLMGGTCTSMGTYTGTPTGNWNAALTVVNASISSEMFMFTNYGYIGPQMAFDLGATAVTSFGAWAAGSVYSYSKGGTCGR